MISKYYIYLDYLLCSTMKIQCHVAIILAIGLALAILPGMLQQGAFATAEEEEIIRENSTIAEPSGFNAAGGNMTGGNMTGTEESIPTANTTGTDPVIINSQMTD